MKHIDNIDNAHNEMCLLLYIKCDTRIKLKKEKKLKMCNVNFKLGPKYMQAG